MPRKRSFREKLADPRDLPRVEPLTGGMERRYGPGTIVLPAPAEVDHLMRSVPRGRVTTINRIRESLARRHGATAPRWPARSSPESTPGSPPARPGKTRLTA